MSWARGDDRYDDTPKIKRAWRLSGYAVGLHWMAVTSCARHESDGLVDPEWLAERLGVIPAKAARTAIETLVSLGLFEFLPAGATKTVLDRSDNAVTLGPLSEDTYVVHDYLEYQDSSLTLSQRRADERLRKAIGARAKELGLSVADYRKTPGFLSDFPADSGRKPAGIQAASGDPDPTRPDPTRPKAPQPPEQARGAQGLARPAPLPNNRAHGTNPRAVAMRQVADEAAQRASLAVAALDAPNSDQRGLWEQLQPLLVQAVGDSHVTVHVEALWLAGADPDGKLVLDGPFDAWSWCLGRFERIVREGALRLGATARMATSDEHEGFALAGTAA